MQKHSIRALENYRNITSHNTGTKSQLVFETHNNTRTTRQTINAALNALKIEDIDIIN